MSFRGLLGVGVAAALCASCGPNVCREMCVPMTMSVEMPHDGSAYPLADGATGPWGHGFPGGTMLTPLIVLDGRELVVGDKVDVTITHMPDPAAPDAFGEASGF